MSDDEDAARANEAYSRNKPWTKPGGDYVTKLPPDQEAKFQTWVKSNKVPFQDSPTADYDMRGYWKSAQDKLDWKRMQKAGQIPKDIQPGGTKVDPNDGKPHFPDYWKTPYHETFSNESQWADRKKAPAWNDKDQLVTPDGKVMFDDRAKKPEKPPMSDAPTTTVRPSQGSDQTAFPKLSYGDIVKRAQAQGYSKAGAEGIAQNFMRESGGNAGDTTGDQGTSRGLAQWHNSRKAELEAFAKAEGKSPSDPDVQFKFFDKDMREKYPQLRAQLVAETDPSRAEDSFKRVYERPASVLWGNTPGQLANDKYHYSDYAMQEHEGRPNTRTVMMDPQEYLDLSPELEGKPFTSPSGKSLKKSVDSGDAVESIPTMDVRMSGNTGVVTDQDGRHRALLAQQSGLEAIPVAMRQTGEGQPTELQGMSGNVVPADHPPVSQAQPGMWSKLANAIIPSAEAAEPNPYAKYLEPAPQPTAQKPAEPANPYAKYVDPQAQQSGQQQEPDGMLMSAVKGVGAGVGKTVLGGQELVGKGLEAVGATDAGKWLVDDARMGVKNLNQEIAADQKENPWSTGAGEVAGGLALPMGAAGLATKVGGRLAGTLAGGVASGALEPSSGDDDHYWREKAKDVGLSTGLAAGGNALAKGAAFVAAPALRKGAELLSKEGVTLTPGQMAGGAVRHLEDMLASVPILGTTIRAAQRRSVETFNRAAMNRALADIHAKLPDGVTSGHDAIAETRKMFTDAYNQVIPNMRGIRDPTFMRDINGIMTSPEAQKLPDAYRDQLQHILQTEIVDRFEPNGQMAGDIAQNVGTRMDELANPLKRGNVYEQQLARLIRQADVRFDQMMDAHNGVFSQAKAAIDSGYAKFKIIQKAASQAASLAESPDGTFTPRQLIDAVRNRDMTKDKRAFSEGAALLQDLASAARDVLPQKVPNSGTAERAALMAGISGAVPFEPHLAAMGAAASLPYLKPIHDLSNKILERALNNPTQGGNALAGYLRAAGPAVGTTLGAGAAQRVQGP